MMGFARSFSWMNSNVCKKQCRSLYWRVRAAVKKSVKSSHYGGKKQVTFHYDPSSYALNFDESSGSREAFIAGVRRSSAASMITDDQKAIGYYYKLQFFFFLAANTTWVYVFLIRL